MIDTDKYEEEIELWIDNFEVTSQSVGDLEQQYEDLLREKTKQMILESEGLDWKSIAYMTARLNVEMGYTCASLIEGSERMIDTDLLAEVERLRKQVSKAKEWVRSYFINMSGDFNSLEDKVVYDDFMQQMGVKKND